MPAERPFKAVLFDLDGTLIDSMKYHVAAWKQAFAEAGYYPDKTEFYLNEGVKHPITVRDRLKSIGVVNPPETLVTRIYTRKRELFNETADYGPTKGVPELLRELKGKVKLGIVTGSVREVVEKVVSRFFDGYFDFVVDYESTRKGKPDPEPYLAGIKSAGFPASDILAIENAPTGVASALGAGLTCWAVCTTLAPEYLAQADKVFKDFIELKKYLLQKV